MSNWRVVRSVVEIRHLPTVIHPDVDNLDGEEVCPKQREWRAGAVLCPHLAQSGRCRDAKTMSAFGDKADIG